MVKQVARPERERELGYHNKIYYTINKRVQLLDVIGHMGIQMRRSI